MRIEFDFDEIEYVPQSVLMDAITFVKEETKRYKQWIPVEK